jgi:hypothetical protein
MAFGLQVLHSVSDSSQTRATRRVQVYCPVSIWGDPEQNAGVCVNVSRGGMALSIAQPLPVGTLLRVTALLPSGRTLDATVVVVWVRSGREHRIGVSFVTLNQEALSTVTDYVEEAKAA